MILFYQLDSLSLLSSLTYIFEIYLVAYILEVKKIRFLYDRCAFSGVLWLYNNIINNSNVVINRLLEMKKKVYFITNNSTKTRDELVEKARSMQFNVGIVS